MSWNKVFQNSQAFTEISLDRSVNDTTGRICHQTTHTSQLTDLLRITAGTRISHHIHRVKRIHCGRHKLIGYIISSLAPKFDNLAITFVLTHQTTTEHTLSFIDFFFRSSQNLCLFRRNFDIGNSNGNTCFTSIVITHFLNNVKDFSRTQIAIQFMYLSNKTSQFFFIKQFIQMPYFNFFTGFVYFIF